MCPTRIHHSLDEPADLGQLTLEQGVTKMNVELENCYGIRALKCGFDFSKQRVYAIYAPNGVMKSSLAQTLKDIADDVRSRDRFYSRVPLRRVTDENGADLPKESILVISPYDILFGHTEKTSTLLVDTKLREEYEQLHQEIDKAKAALLKALKEQSGSRKNLEQEIASTFTKNQDQFYLAMLRLQEELLIQTEAPFANVAYDKIFDDKVLAFLKTKDFKIAIEDYVKRYNELLAASTFFSRNTFNYYNASTIAKSLASNGFFKAKHTVKLNADTSIEITSSAQLEEFIAKEKEGISNDEDLRKKFAEIENLLSKNVNLREFQAYLAEHEEFLSKLANIESFKEEIWKSYLKANFALYNEVTNKYRAAEKRKKEIEREAANQRTQWKQVIDIFNRRFFVPFKLIAKNEVAVILGKEPMLSLGFVFNDGEEPTEVEKTELLDGLSSGEKKAFYILNVIFEVEARKKANQETIIIFDDIADSFDYKNKYAIIQYLKDISEQPSFRQIILTHNFDFFRTVNSRFVNYDHCLMAYKSNNTLSLTKATGIKNIFVNDWKVNFFSDPKKRIASIPFIRNIIEYTKGELDPNFIKLTSLLHWKKDSARITEGELDSIYNSVFGEQGHWRDHGCLVIKNIRSVAQECLKAEDGINFENKIILSIAIRIMAERFMFQEIKDPGFVLPPNESQTWKLFEKYKEAHGDSLDKVEIIERVILMTPENIHLNSFMYEPILDMSDAHLRELYVDVLALNSTAADLFEPLIDTT